MLLLDKSDLDDQLLQGIDSHSMLSGKESCGDHGAHDDKMIMTGLARKIRSFSVAHSRGACQ